MSALDFRSASYVRGPTKAGGKQVSVVAEMAMKAENADGAMGSPITFRISSSAQDKAKDTLNVEQWKTDEWNTNPVVLYMHDNYGLPIAKGLRAWVEQGYLKSQAVFASAIYPLADTVERMIRADFLRAASVGFVSDDYSPNDDGGLDFHSQTLREWSVVTIGCNGDALVEAKAAGIDTEPMREWAHHTLERLHGSGVWVPKDEATRIAKALGEIKTFSIPAPSASTEKPMKTITLSIEVDEAKAESVEAELVKKAKNLGATATAIAATKGDAKPDADADALGAHVKAFGSQLEQHKAMLDAHAKANDDMAAHMKALAKCIKDMDGDEADKGADVGDTKGANGHKLSASQMKRAKACLKASGDMIAAHHSSQGAADGEPDADDEGKAALEAKTKAADEARIKERTEILAALNAATDKLEMKLTGKVPDKRH